MKKIFALLLAAACLLSLAACGEVEPAPSVITQPTTQSTTAPTTAPTTLPTTAPTVQPSTQPDLTKESVLVTDKQQYDTNETVFFECISLPGKSTLWVIYPDGSAKTYADVGASYALKVTVPGRYKAMLDTVTSTGSVKSPWVEFEVIAAAAKPTTKNPTVKPTTVKPTTVKPTTVKPTTVKPTTAKPATVAPTTVKPATAAPTTSVPTTVKPTTVAPTTVKPTTTAPTMVKPTTAAPTTVKPTTVAPTTVKPTTVAPTTVKPTTVAPTTVKPTTVPTTKPDQLKVIGSGYSWMGYTDDRLIPLEKDGLCGAVDRNGNVVIPFEYEYMTAVFPGGYILAQKKTEENPMQPSHTVEWNGKTYECTCCSYDGYSAYYRNTIRSYLYDMQGNVLYSTEYLSETCVDYGSDFSTEGEYILYAANGRIVTAWDNRQEAGIGYNPGINISIRDMKGNVLKRFENVTYYTFFSDGKMVVTSFEYIDWDSNGNGKTTVIDENGTVLAESDMYFLPDYDTFDNKTSVNGYFKIDLNIVSTDLSKTYRLHEDSAIVEKGNPWWPQYDNRNIGTIIAAHILKADGTWSEEAYLVDVAKCQTDADGNVVPTIDTVLCKTGYDLIEIPFGFDNTHKYVRVTHNGKQGYLTLDGKTEVLLYEDAGMFLGGLAIVKDETGVYVIDENFNKVSNTLTDYDSVGSAGKGVYQVEKDGVAYLAVYNP